MLEVIQNEQHFCMAQREFQTLQICTLIGFSKSHRLGNRRNHLTRSINRGKRHPDDSLHDVISESFGDRQ